MPKILVIFLISINCFANYLVSGDVLLQPLDCWSCNLIEQQEESEYSHIGIYLNLDGKDMVLEAYGSVKLVSLKEFLSKTQDGLRVKVIRAYDYKKLNKNFQALALSYVGHSYDSKFLWNNKDENMKEKMYCSELLYKILKPFITFYDLRPKVMHFDINPLLWDRFFRNNTPRGKIGISPEDFNKSTDFTFIQYL